MICDMKEEKEENVGSCGVRGVVDDDDETR